MYVRYSTGQGGSARNVMRSGSVGERYGVGGGGCPKYRWLVWAGRRGAGGRLHRRERFNPVTCDVSSWLPQMTSGEGHQRSLPV